MFVNKTFSLYSMVGSIKVTLFIDTQFRFVQYKELIV